MSEPEDSKEEPEASKKCAWCEKQIPNSWRLVSFDGYVIYFDRHDRFAHRHNFTYGENQKGKTAGKKKNTPAPSSTEKDLLKEYFKTPGEAPASAQILARKAAGGDISALRELHKRYGVDQPHKYDIPVQVVMGDGGGEHNDPRPVMNIKKGLLSEAWDEEDEAEYRQSEEDTQ